MSMINVSIDTSKQTMDIEVDGKTLKNVCSIYCCTDGGMDSDEMMMNITTRDQSADESVNYTNMISLAEQKLVRDEPKEGKWIIALDKDGAKFKKVS